MFIEHLLSCAISRHCARQRYAVERFIPGSGYGLYAAAPSAALHVACMALPTATTAAAAALPGVNTRKVVAAEVSAAVEVATTLAAASGVAAAATASSSSEEAAAPPHTSLSDKSLAGSGITHSSVEKPPSNSLLPTACISSNAEVEHMLPTRDLTPSSNPAASEAALDSSVFVAGCAEIVAAPETYRRARFPYRVGCGFQAGELVVRYEGESHHLVSEYMVSGWFK